MRFMLGILTWGTLFLILTGCQSNEIEEVVNNHNDIQNLDRLDKFVENIKNKKNDKINYIRYGVDGQKGVMALKFNGEQINVSYSVDSELVEEYNCKTLVVETKGSVKDYSILECDGDFKGDIELLSVPIS